MNEYITNDPKYLHPSREDRFQLQSFTEGKGVELLVLIDTFRELQTPTTFPIVNAVVKYRVLKSWVNPTFDAVKVLKQQVLEMNVLFQFNYYLQNC